MKQNSISIICLLVVTQSIFTSCGKKNRGSPSGKPYKAVVLSLTSVDTSDRPHFSLAEKTFSTLNDLDTLDGTYAKILRGGELTVKEVNGSIVSADSFTGGADPALRYTLDGDVVISSDYSTLAMLSAYYQLDYIYSKVTDVLGVDPSKLQEKLPGGKHTVLFEPQIVFKLSNAEGNAGMKLNAAFSPKDKQFLLFQRSGLENVPLSSNLQVISHEFGHSIFDFAFLGGVYDEKNYLPDTYALRGLNEGWADFVSWNFTGSPDILRSSINITAIADERYFTKTTFKWDDIVSQSISKDVYNGATGYGRCAKSFYCIGTVFARSLYQAKADLSSVDAKTFASGLVTSLQSAQAEIKSISTDSVPTAVKTDGDMPSSATEWTKQGKFVGAFLRAVVKNSPAAWKSNLCTRFIENFSSDGFPATTRDGVCP